MANYANAKAIIAQNIYTNHAGQVTAEMVKTAANEIVNTLIAGGYLYAGIAHPGDAAVSPDANVFYIATEAGTYTNKGGLVVADGEVAVLKYNGSWSKEVTGAATAAKVTELGQKLSGFGCLPFDFHIIGGILSSDGSDSPNNEWRRTEYVVVSPGDKLAYDLQGSSSSWCIIACYDSNGDYISSASVTGTSSGIFVIPSVVAKIRLASRASYSNTFAKLELIADGVVNNGIKTPSIIDKAVTKEKLSSDVASVVNKSLLNFGYVGGILYSDGSYSDNIDHICTGYILVDEGDEFDYDVIAGSLGWAAVAAYDSDFNYQQNKSIQGSNSAISGTYKVSAGVRYVVFSGTGSYSNKIHYYGIDDKLERITGIYNIDDVGGILYADGSYSTNINFRCTPYIPVEKGDIVTCIVNSVNSNGWAVLALYDSNREYIQNLSIKRMCDVKLVIPAGVGFIRSCRLASDNNAFLGININITEKNIDSVFATQKNTVSFLKYPNILETRACIAIQMDVEGLEAQGGMEMLSVLREYGLMSMDYATFVSTIKSKESAWLLARQQDGCEIIYHNRINSPANISEASTLTIEEAQEGIWDEKLEFIQTGFTPFGMVAQNGDVGARYKPMLDKIFSWLEYGSYDIRTAGGETTKTQYLTDHRINRTAFEIMHADHSAEAEQDMINKGKAWVDTLIQNKSMGVIYCHFYNRPNLDLYGMYPNVLRAMCEYIVEKIVNGYLYYGSTTECLNYLCR